MVRYKYKQLAEQLEGEIKAQRLPSGKKIPTEDELAEKYQMSRNTVRQAVQLLVDRGYLVKIQGSGTFVAEQGGGGRRRRREPEKGRCIAVVMNQVNSYIFPSVLMGISDYLLEHGYHMIIRMTFNRIAGEAKVLAEMLDADVAGFIIEPARSGLPTVNRDLYQRIRDGYPCVTLHAKYPEFGFPAIDNSNIEGFGMLIDHLVANGHTDIGLLCKSDEQSGDMRFLGYAAGLQKHGIPINEKRVFWYDDEDFEDIFSDANAHRVLKVIRNCTAVMCFNDDLARKLLVFLDAHRIRVPEDLSVVGFDDMQQDQITKPLTTIAHPKEEMGRAAAKAIVTLIDNPAADVSWQYPPRLIIRQTVFNRLAVSAE